MLISYYPGRVGKQINHTVRGAAGAPPRGTPISGVVEGGEVDG
jgi:hypothetical protein